ncbi:MAG TPA: S49 family peptidase, partial [Polyangiaceae bacterium]|nr:S49 family peptidase [Polyangiaceae bacterium]
MKRLFLFLLLAAACEGRPRLAPGVGEDETHSPGAGERRVLEFDVSSGAPEASGGGLFPQPVTRTYAGLVRALERGLEEDTTASVFVRLGGQSFDLAQAEEVGGLLARYSKRKIPVVCHAYELGNASAALAARGCTRRWLSPAGSLDTIGIAAQMVYMKGLLDKLGVEVDFLAMGRYKSAGEALTREGPSEDAERNLTETLASIRQGWLANVADEKQRAALEHGPWAPEEAKAQGLVDAIGFESEALAEAKKLGAVTSTSAGFGPRTDSGHGFDIAEIV